MPNEARVGEANGRVYDPLTAQFFSPDPVLTDAGNWLDYNRYGYCLNNPFRYTDPSGYSWWAENWQPVVTTASAIVVGVAVSILTGGIGSVVVSGMLAGAAGGFTSGAVGTAVYGGSLSDALGAGIKGAMIGGIAGMAGGVASQWMTGIIGSNVGGFAAGAAIGATGGAAGGFVGGSIGAWLDGASFGDGLMAGLKGAGIGALAGGLIGGTIKGIDAVKNGKASFWDGHIDFDLSKGYGATIGGKLMMSHLKATYKGLFEDAAMYESASLGDGGVTLPEYGIVVGKGVYSSTVSYYKEIKQHEYGHILQYKQFLSDLGSEEAALSAYYQQVAVPSAFSATMHTATGGFWNHYTLAVEMEANRLSSSYFGSRYIPNPVKFPFNNAIFSFTIPLN